MEDTAVAVDYILPDGAIVRDHAYEEDSSHTSKPMMNTPRSTGQKIVQLTRMHTYISILHRIVRPVSSGRNRVSHQLLRR
jgi:hypothetical protein